MGTYEYGPRTLTVDAAALVDPAALLFSDLQSALDAAMTGDLVEVRTGTYTGNFTAYRDVTIRHAGVQVSKLSPELGYDLRAILQASSRTPQEQKTLDAIAGTTLTVQGYAPTSTSIQPTGDVTVNLEGLTIRHGAGDLGGGVHNLGQLTIDGSTIEGNAATGESGDFGRGGGIYNAGSLALTRSTLSGNCAGAIRRRPLQRRTRVRDRGDREHHRVHRGLQPGEPLARRVGRLSAQHRPDAPNAAAGVGRRGAP